MEWSGSAAWLSLSVHLQLRQPGPRVAQAERSSTGEKELSVGPDLCLYAGKLRIQILLV